MSDDSILVKTGSSTSTYSTEEKLLGDFLDSEVTFKQHVSNLQGVSKIF